MVSKRKSLDSQSTSLSIFENLRDVYNKKIKPVEEHCLFSKFGSPPLTDGELGAKPIVLLLGQYSTGKTSFIQHLLGRDYPGAHIGPEPTTDRFVAVTYGEEERVIPGNAAATQHNRPFTGLSQFGSTFLSKFQVSESPAALLDSVTFIDTPGVLSGDKQRLGRSYDFVKVCQWFAERADMILILFDAHKLDISDELKDVINVIRPHEDKIKIVLNKADQISSQELMRVYGALMWSLGKTIYTPEVVRVYIGSFWMPKSPVGNGEQAALLEAEQTDLLKHLHGLPKDSAIRKINEMIKRAKQIRVHAIILGQLRYQMPSFWGKANKQNKMIANMKEEMYKVQQEFQFPICDLPDPGQYQDILRNMDISSLPKISTKYTDMLNEAITSDLPNLLQAFVRIHNTLGQVPHNPFDNSALKPTTSAQSSYEKSAKLFYTLHPDAGKISGDKAREVLEKSGLGSDELAKIWAEADEDQDGQLTEAEFCKAMELLNLKSLA